MHEVSLFRNIFKAHEDEFPQETGKIRGIHLSVGLLSNVQPILMQNVFEAVLPEKPRKYPRMFLTSELMLVSKADLLPYVPFSVDAVTQDARDINPGLEVITISALREKVWRIGAIG